MKKRKSDGDTLFDMGSATTSSNAEAIGGVEKTPEPAPVPTGGKMRLSDFVENPDNPQTITDQAFDRLLGKVERIPSGLTAKRIAYVTDHAAGKYVVLSGNKRLRALKRLHGDDAELPKLRIEVDEPPIMFGEVIDEKDQARRIGPRTYDLWSKRKAGDTSLRDVVERTEGKISMFNHSLIHRDRICPTMCATTAPTLYDYPRPLNGSERVSCATFPIDYECTFEQLIFLTGMCVPPVMIAHIADAIWNQWLRPIRERAKA